MFFQEKIRNLRPGTSKIMFTVSSSVKRIGRSKVLTKKACGEIEEKIERGEAGFMKKDYPIMKFFKEYLNRTEMRHSVSYHKRNDFVIRNFTKYLDEKMFLLLLLLTSKT